MGVKYSAPIWYMTTAPLFYFLICVHKRKINDIG